MGKTHAGDETSRFDDDLRTNEDDVHSIHDITDSGVEKDCAWDAQSGESGMRLESEDGSNETASQSGAAQQSLRAEN